MVGHIDREMKLHVEYCRGFGIPIQQMMAAEESAGM